MAEIPVLDLSDLRAGRPGALARIAGELRQACEQVGFYYLTGHGVPRDLVDRVFDEARRFHAQPLDAKLELKAGSDNVGYMPHRGSVSRASRIYHGDTPNRNEAFFLKRDLPPDHPDVLAGRRFRPLNRWPADLPGFRETVLDYADRMEALALSLLPIYAQALELPETFFDEAFRDPQYTLRLTRYDCPSAFEDDEFSLAPHTDSSFMTLLATTDVPGLSIRLPSGDWIDAPALPDSFIVNTGDMGHRWTNERFLSTPHRVRNLSGRERYAIPFFFDCTIDYPMECLPTCQGPDNPPRYPPTTYHDYMVWFTNANYAHVRDAPSSTTGDIAHPA